jgi:hypothetical protein
MLCAQQYHSNTTIKAQKHRRFHQEECDGKTYKERQFKDLSKH